MCHLEVLPAGSRPKIGSFVNTLAIRFQSGTVFRPLARPAGPSQDAMAASETTPVPEGEAAR
jgi:hypothetical protein